MTAMRTLAGALCVVAVWIASVRGDQNAAAAYVLPTTLDHDRIVTLLTSYERGAYDEFDKELAGADRLAANWELFESDAEGWIAGSADQLRRRLVAAAVALEIAGGSTASWPANRLAIEVGCRLMQDQAPTETERAWHRAALAMIQLHRDTAALSAPPGIGLAPQGRAGGDGGDGSSASAEGSATGDAVAPAKPPLSQIGRWFDHSHHVAVRFPDEARPALLAALMLESRFVGDETLFVVRDVPVWMTPAEVDRVAAEGERAITGIPPNRRMDAASAEKLIALVPQLASGFGGSGGRGGGGASAAVTSRRLWQAASAFERLVSKEGVTSEALIHAGQLYVRLARPGEALLLFQRADVAAATPYESYLARTLGGAVLERVGRRDDAIVSFLGALEVVPRAQSATLALAPLLFETGKREEAADLIEEAVRLPVVADPLQYYWQGDPDAVWRALVQLRKAFK